MCDLSGSFYGLLKTFLIARAWERPSGSTTAAIISILHHITDLLKRNTYVTLISLDFSKAFDTVRHATLAAKLSKLDLPDEIYNWLVNFLQDRAHVTRYAGRISVIAHIYI